MPEITVGTGTTPSWQDIILSGNTALTLTNALADGINYLKLFGGTEQRNIPSEFTQVEYLESSGTQYIDTGYKPNTNTAISMKYYPSVNSSFMCLYGTQDTTNANRFYGLISSTQFRVQINSNAGQTPNFWGMNNNGTLSVDTNGTFAQTQGIVTLGVDNKNKVISIKSDEYTGNVSASSTVLGDNLNCSYSLLLLSRGTAGVAANNFKGRLYSFTIKDNGVLIQNLIPARRNSDNVLGMYDTVSGNFLTNQGTGTFTAGADVTTPTPDTPIDIVSNNGAVKVNRNLYTTEYHGYQLSQVDGVTLSTNAAVNVSGMVDCRTIKSFKITTISPQGSFRIFKYGTDNTFIDAISTANIGDIVTLEDNVGFFRIQYNFTKDGTKTENILIYNSAYNLNAIYTDGTVETVQVTGKNLFDKNDVAYNNSTILADGSIISAENISVLDYIPVQPNTTYTYSSTTNSARAYNKRMVCFDANKNYITSIADTTGNPSGSFSITGTTPANTKYVRVACSNDQMATAQLEQGSTATAYEPYTVLGSATAENLFKVSNYQDVQEVLTGSVTRNVGVKVFDGTEDWTQISSTNYVSLLKSVINLIGDSNATCLMTSLNQVLHADINTSINCFSVGASYLNCKLNGYTSVTDFKQYLASQYNAGTPVIIVYPLATATTETVTGQPLTTQAGTNIVEITQASMDNLPLEVSYKAGVAVTITEVQNARLDNNVEVTING